MAHFIESSSSPPPLAASDSESLRLAVGGSASTLGSFFETSAAKDSPRVNPMSTGSSRAISFSEGSSPLPRIEVARPPSAVGSSRMVSVPEVSLVSGRSGGLLVSSDGVSTIGLKAYCSSPFSLATKGVSTEGVSTRGSTAYCSSTSLLATGGISIEGISTRGLMARDSPPSWSATGGVSTEGVSTEV